MKILTDVDYTNLINGLLSGEYKIDTDEFVDALDLLHGNLRAMDDLIQLSISSNKECQFAAAYIAALEGEKACTIFPYICPLLSSRWVVVRDEVCDCFISCGSSPEHFIKLFDLFNDEEQSIRLKVLQVLHGLDLNRLNEVYDFVKENPQMTELSECCSIILRQQTQGMSCEDIKNYMVNGSSLIKCFAYVAACNQVGNSDELTKLVRSSNNPDIIRYHDIYFLEDYSVT